MVTFCDKREQNELAYYAEQSKNHEVILRNDKSNIEKMTSVSLYQLNQTIKESLRRVIPTTLWVRAEIHNITTNFSGHCYLDIIEKDQFSDQIIAKQRATIWASNYRILFQKFNAATGGQLQAGIKILIEVSVEFHELYGLSLNVKDIDPTYTLGELQRRRLEIIERLKKRGLIDKNRSLPIPRLLQRIAIISSPTAAGYADFLHQLTNNKFGFYYNTTLFSAIMQGTQTETSILSALDVIQSRKSEFDIVVIIRGGGATSDLQAFDSERLAESCALFPLPILTGIGHLRDETILDMVAYLNIKTPTAVAEYIISHTLDLDNYLVELANRLSQSVSLCLEQEKNRLISLSAYIPQFAQRLLSSSDNYLLSIQHRIELKTADLIAKNRLLLDRKSDQLSALANQKLQQQQNNLKLIETKLQLLDPQQLLKKGYSFTTHNGKLVTSVSQLTPGDVITTTIADGAIISVVE